jgi:hypothetical protein
MGALIVEGEDGKAVNPGEYVTYHTYFYKWKRDLPNLNVRQPVKDICPYCYAFANGHRYLANCSGGSGNDGNNKGGGNGNGLGLGKGKGNKGNKGNADCNGNKDAANLAICKPWNNKSRSEPSGVGVDQGGTGEGTDAA